MSIGSWISNKASGAYHAVGGAAGSAWEGAKEGGAIAMNGLEQGAEAVMHPFSGPAIPSGGGGDFKMPTLDDGGGQIGDPSSPPLMPPGGPSVLDPSGTGGGVGPLLGGGSGLPALNPIMGALNPFMGLYG